MVSYSMCDALIVLPWRGKRYAIVMYTGVAWDKVPTVLQRRMHELNFPL